MNEPPIGIRPGPDGEPRPPRAPKFKGPEEPPNGKKPEPPHGWSPTLTWRRDTHLEKIFFLPIIFGVYVAGLSALTWFNGDGLFDWMSWWPMWLFPSVGAALSVAPFSIETQSAGANWFNKTTMRFGFWNVAESTVDLYRLTRVDIDINIGEAELRLESWCGALAIPFYQWQRTRLMWDLVYNGIVHSVANGAKISDRAWKWLELDDIEGLAEAAGRTSTS